MTTPRRRTVGVLVFDDVEVLDFCGPFEVFASAKHADLPDAGGDDDQRILQVLIIAEKVRTITCRGGLLVVPHSSIDTHPPLDLLVVPGGRGTRRERHNARLLDWIAKQHKSVEATTSVCTGAFLLAEVGILDNRRATTHWAAVQWMRDQYPNVTMLDDVRVVDEGDVVTSAGVSAGIDMSLHMLARLYGEDVADQTARSMEYDGRG